MAQNADFATMVKFLLTRLHSQVEISPMEAMQPAGYAGFVLLGCAGDA